MDTRTPTDLEEWHAERRDALEHAAEAVDLSENGATVVAACVIGAMVTVGAAVLLFI